MFINFCGHTRLIFEGRRYCLRFGINLAPSIIPVNMDAALSKDKAIRQETSAYINNVFIDENTMSAARVRQHLVNWNGCRTAQVGGLKCTSIY